MFPGLEVQETKTLTKRTFTFFSLGRQLIQPLPWAVQHPTSKRPHNSLRGPKLGPQHWFALESWDCVEVQKAKTKDINLSKEMKSVKFSTFQVSQSFHHENISSLHFQIQLDSCPAPAQRPKSNMTKFHIDMSDCSSFDLSASHTLLMHTVHSYQEGGYWS